MQQRTISPRVVLRIACRLMCDRRTVQRYFTERPMTGSMRERIEHELEVLGLNHLKRDEAI